MFLEDMFLEDAFLDDDNELFSEALSFRKKAPEPELTKKEKVIKAANEAWKKKSTKITAAITGGLVICGSIYVIAKKIKNSAAAKNGQIDVKDVDEKVKITKKIQTKFQELRKKLAAALKERAAKKTYKKGMKNYRREIDEKNFNAYDGSYTAIIEENPEIKEYASEANRLVKAVKSIGKFMANLASKAGEKADELKKALSRGEKQVQESTSLFENPEYREMFESVLFDDISVVESNMENIILESEMESFMLEELMEKYEDEESYYGFC